MEGTTTVQAFDGEGNPISEPFELEASEPGGMIPERVIDELVQCRTIAKDYAEAYAEAIKAQAEKYKLKAGALRRFVNAKQADKVEDLNDENDDLAKLLA